MSGSAVKNYVTQQKHIHQKLSVIAQHLFMHNPMYGYG